MTNEQRDTPPRLAAVIVTHGALAESLRRAAEQVVGNARAIEAVSNDGLNAETLTQRVRDAVRDVRSEGCIVFVDSRGSSCANSCMQAVRGLSNVRVVSGVNLPMIMDFTLRREDHDLDAMVERLIQRGRNSIQELRAPQT